MEALPHLYKVKVEGAPTGNLNVQVENVPSLSVSPPAQFDGPGDQWSPEDLLMSSISSCLLLSFRALAKASRLAWLSVACESQGELDKVERRVLFTKISTKVILTIPAETSAEAAERLLNKAEQTCFITNSLTSETYFECEILRSE